MLGKTDMLLFMYTFDILGNLWYTIIVELCFYRGIYPSETIPLQIKLKRCFKCQT